MDEKNKNIELRSDEIQDILGKVPPFLVRSGITGISIIVIVLIAIAAWFKYPDRILSEIQLTTDNPPVYIISRTTAKITDFFVKDNQEVKRGALLAVLESGAMYNDVLAARELVDSIITTREGLDSVLLKKIFSGEELELGTLQDEYAGLQKAIQELLDFIKFDKYLIRIRGLENELKDYGVHYNRLWEQRQNKEKELEIAEKQYNRMDQLHSEGAVSELELETAEQNYLSQKGQLENARIEMSNTAITMSQLEQSINEFKIERNEERLNAIGKVMESKDRFLSALTDWEQKYLLISPADGLVSLGNYWSENQEAREGDRIMAIVQETSGPIIGKLVLPGRGAGKVEEGQKVIIKFDRYPYMEFGLVTGIVESISLVPDGNNYYVEVGFPDGLTTSYNQELDFTQEMTGQAEIITETRSFLVRIITPIKSLLRRNEMGN
jgi:HlyD family secretion protein